MNVLDRITRISDSPPVVIGVLVGGLILLWLVGAYLIRAAERATADLMGGDLLRPSRHTGAGADPITDEDAPDRPLIGRLR